MQSSSPGLKKSKSNWKERKHARAIFKRLKAGLVSWEELSQEEFALLEKYYGWLFWKKVRRE